ncbi:MAG: hypothetical protein AABZ34_02615 [Nitrospirota bacterium]
MDGTISNPMEGSAAFDRKEFDWHSIARDIAEEFSCLISDVEEMLSQERHQLEREAQIKACIPLLAIKQVKELLRLSWRVPLRHEPTDQNHPLPAHDGMGP